MITAIITAYRRPRTLAPLTEAVRRQGVPPNLVWAWANDPSEELSRHLRLARLDRVVTCSQNAYFHGRFALALLAPTEFVALFDDDSIPGRDWFANCLETIDSTPGILGAAGLVLHGPSYAHRTMHGWQRPNDEAVEVDLVGQAWFLRTEWLRYLFAERPITLTNGEDIELAARAWRLAGIRSYCPPHPAGDLRRWGSTRGMELGIDAVATSLRSSHEAERDAIVKTEIAAGWLPLFVRSASVGNAVSGVPRSGIRENSEASVAGTLRVPSSSAASVGNAVSGVPRSGIRENSEANVAGTLRVPSSSAASVGNAVPGVPRSGIRENSEANVAGTLRVPSSSAASVGNAVPGVPRSGIRENFD